MLLGGRAGRILAQEVISGVVWLYVLNTLGKVELAPVAQVGFSVAAGLALGAALAAVAVWMKAPIRRAPGVGLAARIAVWLATLAMAAIISMFGWPGAGAGLIAAATAVFGLPIMRQVREVRAGRPPPPNPARRIP